MIRITGSEIMHPSLLIGARCFHQMRGDTRVLVRRMYTVARTADGSGAEIFLLTRYVTRDGENKSSILAWDPEKEAVCTEMCSTPCANELNMLALWKGGFGRLST